VIRFAIPAKLREAENEKYRSAVVRDYGTVKEGTIKETRVNEITKSPYPHSRDFGARFSLTMRSLLCLPVCLCF
jgi:hypothetical protein